MSDPTLLDSLNERFAVAGVEAANAADDALHLGGGECHAMGVVIEATAA